MCIPDLLELTVSMYLVEDSEYMGITDLVGVGTIHKLCVNN